MSNLGPQQQNLSFAGLLQVPGGITTTLQNVTDGNGNPTALSLSSNAISAIGFVSNTSVNIYGGSAGQIPFQTGLSATSFIANGTTGQLLQSNGSSAPSFATVTASSLGALPLTGGNLTGPVDLGSNKITSLATPTVSTDAANKAYVDSVAVGLQPKAAVVCASTTNIATLFGLLTIDGVTVTAGQRVLIKNQSASANNGIYAAATGAWTRTSDANTWALLVGASVFVSGGTTNANTSWVTSIPATGTLGTTAITFVQLSASQSYLAGAGLTLSGNQFSITAPVATSLGGTNNTATPTAGGVAYGDGSKISYTAAGTAGQVMTSNGSSAPTFQALPSNNSGIASYSGTALTGAYSRLYSDSFGDVRSVFDFAPTSAQTNGSYDWTSAIQAAHDSLSGNGGLVYFPSNQAGWYLVNSTVNISKANVLFDGCNSTLNKTVDGTFFSSTNQFCTIKNFVLYGIGKTGPSASNYAVTTSSASANFYMENVFIRYVGSGVALRGIYFNLNNVSVNDYVTNTGIAYLVDHIGSVDPTGYFNSCECDNLAGAQGLAGILVYGGNTIQVNNCEIQHNQVGLWFNPPSSVTNVNSCFFSNTYFDSNTYAGVHFDTANSPSVAYEQMQFSNCWMTSNAGAGGTPNGVIIEAGATINEFAFSNCIMSGNVTGFYIANNASASNLIRSLILSSCSFEGNSQADVSIGANNNNFIVTGCQGENTTNGIYINAGCNNYVVTNNKVGHLTDAGGPTKIVNDNVINGVAAALGYSMPVQVSSSRSLGTAYQNTKTYPMMVCVTANNGTSGATDFLVALIGSSSNPVAGSGDTVVIEGPGGIIAAVMVTFIVPPGKYYKVSNLYGYLSTVSAWVEY